MAAFGRKLVTGPDQLRVPFWVYCVEKVDVEVGDFATLSSKRGLHSG
jgi:hypothetical protein